MWPWATHGLGRVWETFRQYPKKIKKIDYFLNLGNISKKGLQVLTCDFSSEMKKKIIRFIENSISKYSEFTDIVLNIGNQCKDAFGGK